MEWLGSMGGCFPCLASLRAVRHKSLARKEVPAYEGTASIGE